jgi:hypothetical protein
MSRRSAGGSSVKTRGNENEFFSELFPCKYTFMHSDYSRRAYPLA